MSQPLIQVDGASLKALDALAKVMEARGKYLGDTAKESAFAMLSLVLRSLRTSTKVAKTSGVKVSLATRADLRFSYTTKDKHHRMCLRKGGVRVEPTDDFHIRFTEGVRGVKSLKAVKVYEFADEYERKGAKVRHVYAIAAVSKGDATKAAKIIIKRRILRYAGLARRAVSLLMSKAFTKGENWDAGSKDVEWTANKQTSVTVATSGKTSTITALDNLAYAKNALKNGAADIDIAVQKAVNKTVGQITHRFKDILKPGDLPPVFLEVKSRKAS